MLFFYVSSIFDPLYYLALRHYSEYMQQHLSKALGTQGLEILLEKVREINV
jgi:hypothetical protein